MESRKEREMEAFDALPDWAKRQWQLTLDPHWTPSAPRPERAPSYLDQFGKRAWKCV